MTSTTFFFVFIPLLAIILLAVNLIFAPHNPYQEKDSVFECGFHSFLGQNRTQFSISFFIFALLFLLFDLEILLVYPYVVSAHTNGIYGLVIMLIFFLALTLGFAFELGKNALKIDSRQMLTLNNNNETSLSYVSGFSIALKKNSRQKLALNKVISILHISRNNYSLITHSRQIVTLNKGVSVSVSCISYLNSKNNFIIQHRKYFYTNSKLLSKLENSMFNISRDLRTKNLEPYRAKGSYFYTKDGRKIYDGFCGAAVSCLGHKNTRIGKAIIKQFNTGITYATSLHWSVPVAEQASEALIKTTDGKMARAYFTSSGSEAMDVAIKTVFQYYYFLKDTKRTYIISLEPSWHGATGFALNVSGMVSRKAPYGHLSLDNFHHIPSFNAYRQRQEGESDAAFCKRKVAELEQKFKDLGPEKVAAFVIEPVVGASLGCVTTVPGYLKGVREVCHKYGALLIFDEVMCGMGRTGFMHAWQMENVAPDLQTLGKGLGAGYVAASALLVSHKVLDVLINKSGRFIHSQTYQNMPLAAAVSLEIIKIIQEENLLDNVKKQGAYLGERLNAVLGDHPNVGNIRGRGLFWGLEFVKDKGTKEPFDPKLGVANQIKYLALSNPYNTTFYAETGTIDGVKGDHTMIAPAYNVTKNKINSLVKVKKNVIDIVCSKIDY